MEPELLSAEDAACSLSDYKITSGSVPKKVPGLIKRSFNDEISASAVRHKGAQQNIIVDTRKRTLYYT